jgi:hypothetical protein
VIKSVMMVGASSRIQWRSSGRFPFPICSFAAISLSQLAAGAWQHELHSSQAQRCDRKLNGNFRFGLGHRQPEENWKWLSLGIARS